MPVTPIGQQPVLPNGATVPLVPATRVGELIFVRVLWALMPISSWSRVASRRKPKQQLPIYRPC